MARIEVLIRFLGFSIDLYLIGLQGTLGQVRPQACHRYPHYRVWFLRSRCRICLRWIEARLRVHDLELCHAGKRPLLRD